jgi:hypothetical protein
LIKRRNENARRFQSLADVRYASFGLSLGMMVLGVLAIPGEVWMKGFFMLGTFFVVGSCFTLSKALRDQHEAENLFHKLESAKAERILREYDNGVRASRIAV